MVNKKHKIMIGLVAISVLTIGLSFSPYRKISQPEICIDETCFDIAIANTPEKLEQGLMYVKHMDPKSGMLFVFNKEDIYTFWMKNTLIPLDMIWINKNNMIVDIQEATPCTTDICQRYIGKEVASYVLEINYGLSKKLGITTGQKIKIVY